MFTCPLCNAELVETSQMAVCSFCGATEEAEYICTNGHYQCEECRMASQTDIIERVCLTTHSTNPIELANLIMKHPSFNQYGVEHHELVAPVVLSAIHNVRGTEIGHGKIRAAIKRGSKIPYGACGSMGTCGACVSAGVATAILTGSNYLKDQERNLTLKATATALLKLTDLGGPRCCKFSTYAGIVSAWDIARNDLNIPLPELQVECAFQGKLKECHLDKCPYYER